MKLLLGFIGEINSGKDTAAEYLVNKYGAYHIRQSHILDEILGVLGIEVSRRNEIDLGMALRSAFGADTVGKAVEKRLKQSDADIRVVQGIRFQEEFDIIQGMGAKMVYITAPSDMRYERSNKRREKSDDGQQTFTEFTATEKTEPTEVGIPMLGAQADVRICNDGDLDHLYQQLEQLIHGKSNEKN
nr:AAA domain protein [uncultured bacterium]AIA16345.1 AAA domain protein [uncultured bacterium]